MTTSGSNQEKRVFELPLPEIRENEGKKYIRGYAAKYNELSRSIGWGFKEKFMPGAFDEVIAADFMNDIDFDTVAYFNHNKMQILGRRSSGTLRIGSDAIGLWYEIDIDESISYHADLAKNLERGDVRHSSFVFVIAAQGDGWERDQKHGDVRTVSKVKYLFDVSPVTDPAYATTEAEVAKRSYETFNTGNQPPLESYAAEARTRRLRLSGIK